jgi:predicted DNA-binding transcriptional regulator AlpA
MMDAEFQLSASRKLLTPAQTAEYLTLSISTLARMRISGNGPNFIRLSRQKVGYRQSDLDKFLEARVRTSTSQA